MRRNRVMQKSDSPGVAGLVASMLVIGLTLAGALYGL